MADPPTSLELPIRVRYVECDPMGVAHHSVYPVWLEMGRTELLRAAGIAYRDIEQAGAFFAVTHLDIRYRAPARYDDVLSLHVQLKRMTRARIDHEYRITRDGLVLTEASTTLACVDRSGRVVEIPDTIAGRGA